MPKKITALIIACVVALFGGASVAVPAAASPAQPAAPTAPVPPVKARTAAKPKPANTINDQYVAMSGPRFLAAKKAAADARVRAVIAARAVAPARARAVATARAAAVARARAAALPKATKKQAKVKKRAVRAAAAATKAAVRAVAQARAAVAAVPRARSRASALKVVSDEAWAVYVALAGPRAVLAAKNAARARTRAAAAVRAVPVARARAVSAARAATIAKIKAAAVVRSKVKKKIKKRAAAAAAAAVRASARANAQYRGSIAASARAGALARDMTAAAARLRYAAGPYTGWAPTDTVTFNHPRGSRRQKYALITQLNRAIDATPRGGQIRMAMYLFDIGSVSDKLITAHRRGVNVQVLIDDGMKNKHINKLKRSLGKNKRARSFVAVCDHSCMSQGTSTIHAKFYLFSVAGKSRYVSLVSSGNPYSGNTSKSWNNTHTIVRNKSIYNSLSKYFTDMLPDRTNLNYYRVTKSGRYTVYYYPQKIRKSDDLVWMNVLNRVSCRTTGPGYGNRQRRTLIRVANWGWTQPRIDVARRLWKLHNAGCAVQVIINRARTSKSVFRVLLKRSKRYGKMPVYNAWRDWRKKAVAGLYVHHKFVSINGLLMGRNIKMTLTGSQNFTALGTQANNDLVLRVDDARMTDAYNRNFAFIRDRYTKRMRTVPLITRPADRVGGA